jgi:hypothetical protein
MAKSKPVVLGTQDNATEADLCPAVEEDQAVSAIESDSGSREDAIRSAAYALYEKRNGLCGSAEEDWLQAEARIAQIASPGV